MATAAPSAIASSDALVSVSEAPSHYIHGNHGSFLLCDSLIGLRAGEQTARRFNREQDLGLIAIEPNMSAQRTVVMLAVPLPAPCLIIV